MAKGLLATQEAEYRRLAERKSAEARHREQKALREAAFAKEARAAAELPAGSFAYEQLSDGIPPVENFVQTPVQNLIQQPQHIGGSTTGLIGGPPPIDKRMTLTKRFPQQVGADSYEHRMGVTQQPGLLVDQSNNAGLVGRPQPMPQPTLSDLPSGITQTDIQRMLNYDRRGKQQMTALPDNSGFRPGQQPTLLNQQQMPGARLPRSLVQSSAAQLIGATPPTLSGKTLQPLPNQARTEPMIGQSMFEDNIIQGTLQNEGGIEEGDNHVANRGIDSRHHDIRTQDQKDNGVSNKQAIMDMSEEDAIALYKDKYWEHPRFDEINDVNVGRKVFDMGVNVGTPKATAMLQESLSDLGYANKDGTPGKRDLTAVVGLGEGMGPRTSMAIDQAIADGKKDDLLRLMSEKLEIHYLGLARDDPNQYGNFLNGWLNRVPYESGNRDIPSAWRVDPFTSDSVQKPLVKDLGMSTQRPVETPTTGVPNAVRQFNNLLGTQ